MMTKKINGPEVGILNDFFVTVALQILNSLMFKAGHVSLTVIETLLFSIKSENPLQEFTILFA